jgi:Domain of unknown function (DUF4332)
VEPGNDPNWLVELVCRGAQLANGDYERLIAHYDIGRGVVDPASGLDPVGRRIVARMIRLACLGYAAVLARAIGESGVHAPEAGLVAPTLLAAVRIPAKALARRRAEAEERHAVERMYDELMATGTVEANLPEDDRTVRQLFTQEVLAQRAPRPEASQVFPVRPHRRIVTRVDERRAARRQAEASAEIIPLRPVGRPAPAPAPAAASEAYPSSITREPMLFLVPSEPRPDRPKRASIPPRHARGEAAAQVAAGAGEGGTGRDAHVRLTLDHAVADSPSVGARLAKRLVRHGIATVRDLVKADPAALAVRLGARNLTAAAICAWQDQALLACAIAGLSGAHAGLLVGAGYRSAGAVAEAEPDKLCADVLAFAVTPAGRRILRHDGAPDIERIKGWLAAARGMQAA